jgi:hypothetical protein
VREKSIAEATNALRVFYPVFFWNAEESAQMEALWDAQRAARKRAEVDNNQ